MSPCSRIKLLPSSNISYITYFIIFLNTTQYASRLKWFVFIFAMQVILELRERPDRSAKARRGLTLSLQPLKGFDYDSLLSPPATPDTQLDADTHTHPAAPLPGPARLQQFAQEKGLHREVFVWKAEITVSATHILRVIHNITAYLFTLTHRCGAPCEMYCLVEAKPKWLMTLKLDQFPHFPSPLIFRSLMY